MLFSFSILIISMIIAIYEVPPLIKKKLIKECAAFCFFLGMGTVLTMIKSFGIDLPNPINWLITFVHPLTNFFETLLK